MTVQGYYSFDIFKIISGVILLAFGRRLFWLFIAIIGFLAGMELAGLIFSDQPSWLIVLAALVSGLVGALIAVFAQRVAFALAGFFAGSYLALTAAHSFGAYSVPGIFFIIGGIVGALLSIWFLDWAIIVLSCFVGAAAIVDVLALGQMPGIVVFAVLVSAGVLVQTRNSNNTAKS